MICSCGGALKNQTFKQNICDLRRLCKKKCIKASSFDDVNILLYRLGRDKDPRIWVSKTCSSCGRVSLI
jgi:hypothetical protein